MKLISITLLSLVAFATCEITEEENVLVLTNDNFDDAIEANNFVLVEFYAPWCGHCKALAPEYAEVAARLKEEGSEIKLAKIDATEANKLATKYGVKGYPTLKFFRGDTEDYFDYQVARDASTILAWVKKKSGPAAFEVDTLEQLEDYIKYNSPLAVAFLKDPKEPLVKGFFKACTDLDDTMCVYTHNQELFKQYSITKPDSLVLFKHYDNGRDEINEELSVVQMKDFVNTNKLEIVMEFSQANAQKIFSQEKIKNHVLLFTNFSDDSKPVLKEALRNVAFLHRHKYLFVLVDTNTEANSKVLGYFDVSDKVNPSLRLANMTTDDIKKYVPRTADFSAAAMETFILGVERELVQRHYKTQELPEDWDEEPVKVLTGQNLEQVTRDPTKSVFVEFYAPWCGHCKKLEPIWDDLAEHFSDNADVVIAKLDSTANEFADFKIPSFPTLKYYPKGDTEVIEYSGPREFEPLKKFVDHDGNPPEEPEEEEAKKDEL